MTGPTPKWVVSLRPTGILMILLGQFLFLLLLLLCSEFKWLYVDRLPTVVAGVMPVIVPWGGALGGVCIGLVGVTTHWAKWGRDEAPANSRSQAMRWNGWYLVRLPLGAAFGTVASLIVVLFLGTVGTTSSGGIDVTPIGGATLFVIAFVVGYQQDVFRTLVERVVEVLLGPGTPTPDDAGFTIDSTLAFGNVQQNDRAELDVEIANDGRGLMTIPTDSITNEGDGFSVTKKPGKIAGGGTGRITVAFEPMAAQDYTGTLSVTIDGTERKVTLTGTGTT